MLPDAGDLSYSYHLLTSLGRAGVALTVLAVGRAGDRARCQIADGIEWILIAPREGWELRGRLALGSLFSRLPNVASRYKNVEFRRELFAQLARGWDAIIVDHLGMGWVWPFVAGYQRRNPAVISVFIAHQCEGDVRRQVAQNFHGNVIRKIGLHLDAAKAGALERDVIRKSNLFSVITEEDRHRFGDLAKSVLLTPGYAGARGRARKITRATPRRVLMFGSALWLAKQINLTEFLAVADDLFWHQEIELYVVGKVPDQLSGGKYHPTTRFLGFVDDPEPVFRSVRIGVVAERTGGGFKLKSLDYIFNRVPIAAIESGIAGLPLTPGLDYLSFASMRDLAYGVVATIDDVEGLNTLQETAYAKCSAAFDWRERGQALHEAMQAAARRQGGRIIVA